MRDLLYRWMEADELTKVGEIDRTERVRTGYKMAEGELRQMEVIWDSPRWGSKGEGDHSLSHQLIFCRDHLERNGRLYGAFDGETLVGVGIVQHDILAGMAQLAYLHVSNGYRQMGVGGRIAEALIREAKREGASKMYVSATPSGSAVGFYLSRGFRPTATPVPELFELEPDDIHMTMDN